MRWMVMELEAVGMESVAVVTHVWHESLTADWEKSPPECLHECLVVVLVVVVVELVLVVVVVDWWYFSVKVRIVGNCVAL